MTLPTEMQALVVTEDGYAARDARLATERLDNFLALKRIAVPAPKTGEVLVKIGYASVNPSDIAFVQGSYGQPRVAGQAAGFEAMGEVVAAGGGFMAKRLVGKRIAFVARKGGVWAEYALADAASAIPLDDGVRDEDGAAMIVNPLTAVALFDRVRQSSSKSFVMSAGASQLCKLIIGLAADAGYSAIPIVRRESQMATLQGLGAASVLNSAAADFDTQMRALFKARKPEVFLDAVTGTLAAAVFDAMGTKARWVIYGRLDSGATPISEPGQLIFQEKQIEGFWLVSWLRDASLITKWRASRKVQRRFVSGAWRTDVAAKLSLSDALAQLPDRLAGANQGKILLHG